MKTFLPVVSPCGSPWQTMRLSLESLDNKRLGKQRVESYQIWRTITGLNKTKSWRVSPAIHMWRGYPEALGVYIAINCHIWAKRKSPTTGLNFSNAMMDKHIATFGFGKNDQGQVVFPMDADDADEVKQDDADQTSDVDEEEQKDGFIEPPVPDTIALPAAAEVIAHAVVDENKACAGDAAVAAVAAPAKPQRSGRYVDGVRIPWWWDDMRIHGSDAAILYSKDKAFYKSFKKYHGTSAGKFTEYVWPRDIEPRHPEQAEELDELQAVLDAEEAVKQAKLAKIKAEKEAKREAKQLEKKRKREEEAQAEEAEKDDTSAAMDTDAPAGEETKATSRKKTKRSIRRRVSTNSPAATAEVATSRPNSLTITDATLETPARSTRAARRAASNANSPTDQSTVAAVETPAPVRMEVDDDASLRKHQPVVETQRSSARRALKL